MTLLEAVFYPEPAVVVGVRDLSGHIQSWAFGT